MNKAMIEGLDNRNKILYITSLPSNTKNTTYCILGNVTLTLH